MEYFLLIILLLCLFILAMAISMWRTKRAVVAVVKIFRENNATNVTNAKTAAELGLNRKTFAEGLAKPIRDFKPGALQTLMQVGAVVVTEDDKLYLSEEEAEKIPNLKNK